MHKAIILFPTTHSHYTFTPPQIYNLQLYFGNWYINNQYGEPLGAIQINEDFQWMIALKGEIIHKTHVYPWKLFLIPSTL